MCVLLCIPLYIPLCIAPRTHPPHPNVTLGTHASLSIWVYNTTLNAYQVSGGSHTLPGGAITACAWAPTLGRPVELLAAAAGPHAAVFSITGPIDALQVGPVADLKHKGRVWKLEWNMLGNWLAVGTEDGGVQLWRPDLVGEWALQHSVVAAEDGGAMR